MSVFSLSTMPPVLRSDLLTKFKSLQHKHIIGIYTESRDPKHSLWSKCKRMVEVFENSWGVDSEENDIIMEILIDDYGGESELEYFQTPYEYKKWWKQQVAMNALASLGT